MSAFIQFKDVKKTYKVGDVEIHASNGVNVEVNKGEFVGNYVKLTKKDSKEIYRLAL